MQTLRVEYEIEKKRNRNLRDDTSNLEKHTATISNLILNVQLVNLDVKIPKFSDEDKRYLIEYLNVLDNYFKAKKIADATKLLIIKNSLEDKAKYWFENNKAEITTPKSFKEHFKKAFFLIPI